MKTSIVAIALTVSMLIGTGHAAPITVGAGQSITFNFDFASAGATPAPPYTRMSFFTGISEFDAADAGTWSFFSDIDHAGTNFSSWALAGGSFLDPNAYLPFGGFIGFAYSEMLDGVFSVTVAVTSGSVSVNPFAEGTVVTSYVVLGNGVVLEDSATTQFIYPAISVPEPSALSLLGLGVLAIGLSRYKRRS